MKAFDEKTRNYTIIALKSGITLLLLSWIFNNFDTSQFVISISSVNFLYVTLALLAHITAFSILSLRWWLLLRVTNPSCTFRSIVPAYYLGVFWNNLLPTAIGGDVVRILKLRQKGFRTNDLIHSSLADRVIGLFSIVMLGTMAFVANTKFHVAEFGLILSFLLISMIAGSMVLLSTRSLNFVLKLFRPYSRFKLGRFLILVIETISLYAKDKKILIHVLLYSFVAQFLIILSYICLSNALNISVPFFVYFSIIPVVFLASSIPISIGGLGVRETVLINLLMIYAVEPQASISLSIFYFSMLIILTLPGALFLFDRQKIRTQ